MQYFQNVHAESKHCRLGGCGPTLCILLNGIPYIRVPERCCRVVDVLSCHRFPCVPSFRAPIALCNFWALKNKE